MFETAVCAPAL
uniref:Uncharacterized protein n=1 Tax=Rhizophora mucronata TaxID=61149 RepID=A0A2P2QEQ3_RHIMU